MKIKSLFILIALGAFLLAGCGGAASAQTAGNAEAGKALFEQEEIHDAPGCITCHSTEPGEVFTGPSLAGVASRAASQSTTAEYLRQSILNPDAYVVEGFPSGEMYQDFAKTLSKAELNNLLAYLAQLK